MRSKLFYYRARFCWSILVAVALCFSIQGCKPESPKDQLAAVKALIAKREGVAATIHLKAYLQKFPQDGEARFLLGKALLKEGQFFLASVEFEKARDLKFTPDLVMPELARAQLASGQFKKVIEAVRDLRLPDAKATAEVKTVLASAYIASGMIDAAAAAVGDALVLDPKNVSAKLLKARMLVGRGDVPSAADMVQAILFDEPSNPRALNLLGDIQWLRRSDFDAAEKSYRQALAADPGFVQAHSSLLKLLLQRRRFDDFRGHFSKLKAVAPNHPDTTFFAIQVDLLEKRLDAARGGVLKLMQLAPDDVQVLQIAGAVERQAGKFLVAETHLLKALSKVPDLQFARKLLADIYLHTGQPAKALAVLQPIKRDDASDSEILALMGEAYLQVEDYASSEKYFSKAAKIAPADASVQTSLAVSQLGMGETAKGYASLEGLAARDASTYADLALISARIKARDIEAALRAIDRLQSKVPSSALPAQLRGQALAARNDFAGARLSYEKAVGLDAVYFPAVAALAALDVKEGKLVDALKQYEQLIAKEPKNWQALIAVAELRIRLGRKPDDVKPLLSEAVRSNPTEPLPRLALVELLLLQRQSKAAIDSAQEALASMPDEPSLLEGLGRAQLAAGDSRQAMATFRKAIGLRPNSAKLLIQLASAQQVSGDLASAASSLRRALEVAPRLLEAQRGLVNVYLQSKRPDEAIKIARSVQRERPSEAAGHVLEAEIHMVQSELESAVAAYRTALAREQSTATAMRLHSILVGAKRSEAADRFAGGWLAEHPKDVAFMLHLASRSVDARDYASAEALYRRALGTASDDPTTLNNVAWLMAKQGKPGALPMIEKAISLRPDEPAFMETLATVLASEKQFAKAIEWQRKALTKAPDVPAYRVGLARLLLEAGDRTAAGVELRQLKALGPSFNGQAEVARLQKQLEQ